MYRYLFALILLAAGCGNPSSERAEEPGDLLLLMSFSQQYLEKLHLAGEAQNWPLADLYAHELEEIGEALRDSGYEVHGTPLASMARGAFLPAVERVEEAIDAADTEAFASAFETVVSTCNSCHAATGYEAIRIIVPEDYTRPYPSQSFVP